MEPEVKKPKLENESKEITNDETGIGETEKPVNDVEKRKIPQKSDTDNTKTEHSTCETEQAPVTTETKSDGPAVTVAVEGKKSTEVSSSSETTSSTFLKEEDVGMLCYISDLPGCHGVIKQRYSDFIVNEIDMNGQVVELTNYDIDHTTEEKKEENKEEDSFSLPEDKLALLTDLSTSKDTDSQVNIEVPDDKAIRTKYHLAIKSKFINLETSTETIDGAKVIKVVRKSGKSVKYNKDRDKKIDWPKGRPNYCRFVLYKENRDTMQAIADISRFLCVNKKVFGYAGTKDKRGKTTQEITVYRLFAERLQELNKRMKYMHFGHFRYVVEPLKLGQCRGNKFTIVLRNVTGDDETLNTAMTSLKEKGFINYFGMQRFGTTSIPTHHIGRAVLKNNFEEAVTLILKPRPGETGKILECRKCWEERKDAAGALALLPPQYSIEKTIFERLKWNAKNFCDAFQKIAWNTRLMYLHGYQSFIWNTVVSKRIKQFGLSLMIGDLVLTQDVDDVQTDEENLTEKERVQPTVIDESNISQYSIQDVVLPLPGHDIMFPNNEVAKWYEALLTEDGLTLDCFKHKVKSLALPGAYRRMLIKPGNVTWKMLRYNDVNEELALSDLDRINNKPDPVSLEDGQFKALRIEMTLPTSCYATMALREITKTDTSASHQSTLNVS